MGMSAYGYIEVKGLVTAVEAANAALTAANVQIVSKENPGLGMIAVVLAGEAAAVRIAVEAACKSASMIGEVINATVIANPEKALDELYSV